MKQNKEILARLAFKNKISQSQIEVLEKELENFSGTIDKFLISNKICTETELYSIIADMFCVPFTEIELLEIDKSLLEMFDYGFLRKHQIVPVSRAENGTLIVAMANVTLSLKNGCKS